MASWSNLYEDKKESLKIESVSVTLTKYYVASIGFNEKVQRDGGAIRDDLISSNELSASSAVR